MKYYMLSGLLSIAYAVSAGRTAELPLPEVPPDLKEPSARASYVIQHFWDGMDWRDTALTADATFMEQNSANFYSLFSLTDSVSASRAVSRMFDGASADMKVYKKLAGIAHTYLFEPESPVASDEAYAVVVDRLLADRKLGDSELLRLEDAHNLLMRNRVGHDAADFEFIGSNGIRGRLSGQIEKHNYLLLMLYDPDCHYCAEYEQHLSSSPLIKKHDVGVLMVNPYGEQDGLWLEHATTMPSDWIVAMTAGDEFWDDELYDMRVIPTVYLLDHQGKVVAKNIGIDKIDDVLNSL